MAGSLEKRGKDSWRLIVSCGMGPDGKQEKKTKTVTVNTSCPERSCKDCNKLTRCKARKEAERFLVEFVAEVEKGLYVDPTKLTLKDFAEKWLRDGKPDLAPKTRLRYREILERAGEAMGHLKLGKIKPLHLVEFYNNLREEGIRRDRRAGRLSEKTILYYHRVLHAMFSDAVKWGILSQNPADKVEAPKLKRAKVSYYDEKQTAELLAALETAPLQFKAAILLELATGLRRGELMGLEWQDVDFEADTIEVQRSSQYLPGHGVFTKEPKTETSKRILAVPASVMAVLKQYKAAQAEHRLQVGDLWQGSNRLFTTWDGRPMHPDSRLTAKRGFDVPRIREPA
ncbi:MAG TPA: site-specific integrase [Firmicutes bacterium]|nr:site-specific integrase [Bacillota bacterium]